METKAIILDKDGTLFPYSLWGVTVRKFFRSEMPVGALGESEKKRAEEEFSVILGVDGSGKIYRDGLFFTRNYIAAFFRLSLWVLKHRMNPFISAKAFLKIRKRFLYGHEEALSSFDFGPVKGKLEALKDKNVSLALFTNDSSEALEMFLSHFSEDTFQYVLDNSSPYRKPHKKTVEEYSRKSGILPENMVVISDSPRDLWMGRRAKVGRTIGIEGTAKREKLEKYSDFIFPDIVSALLSILERDLT